MASKISFEQAGKILQAPPGFMKKKRRLEKLEIFYLPSYIVDVNVTTSSTTTQSFCIDAVLGSFAFFDSSTTTSVSSTTLKTCPFFLSEKEVQARAVDEYRHHLLRTGLKMRYTFEIDGIVAVRRIYYPFWIGYFKRKKRIDFDVIDAVGGEHQGAVMRPVFIKALLHEIDMQSG